MNKTFRKECNELYYPWFNFDIVKKNSHQLWLKYCKKLCQTTNNIFNYEMGHTDDSICRIIIATFVYLSVTLSSVR